MGFSNRDYMRDESESSGRSWADDVPTTKWLIIATVIVFFLQTILTHRPQLPADVNDPAIAALAAQIQGVHPSYVEDWFALDADKVLHGQVWRVFTYFFCHHRDGSPLSLVFNMLGLWFFGSVLERMYGRRELLYFYIASGVVTGLIFTAFGLKIHLPIPQMGASPCVLALFTLYATHFPYQQILFCWVVPIQIRVLLLIYVALDAYNILQVMSGQAPLIAMAYMSNLWGIAFGYLYRRMKWQLSDIERFFDFGRMRQSVRRATTARNLKVYQPESTINLEEQVDAILAKIHAQGSESLTERERAVLQQASDQAKNRL